jgi:hypothetical protein
MGGLHLIMLQVFSFYLGKKIRTFALEAPPQNLEI